MVYQPIVIVHTNELEPSLEVLAETHPDLEVLGCDSYEALPALLQSTGAEVVYSLRFAGTPHFPGRALVECPTVKWLSVGGSGTDHLARWDPARLVVTNAAGVAADMMAEYTIGAMLSFSLGLPAFAQHQRARRWTAGKVAPIQGKTLLILGLGKTGQAVAQRAMAMGLTTLGLRARPQPTEHVDEVHGIAALPGLLGRADFIVVCVPLLETTRGLLDRAAFAAMKPNAVLVDVSRGGVIDEAALLGALNARRLKGAALDVFAVEPLPDDHPLWDYENVIITPHCSSVYEGWELKSVRLFAENLARYRRGESLHNIVDPGRGY